MICALRTSGVPGDIRPPSMKTLVTSGRLRSRAAIVVRHRLRILQRGAGRERDRKMRAARILHGLEVARDEVAGEAEDREAEENEPDRQGREPVLDGPGDDLTVTLRPGGRLLLALIGTRLEEMRCEHWRHETRREQREDHLGGDR